MPLRKRSTKYLFERHAKSGFDRCGCSSHEELDLTPWKSIVGNRHKVGRFASARLYCAHPNGPIPIVKLYAFSPTSSQTNGLRCWRRVSSIWISAEPFSIGTPFSWLEGSS